MPRRPKAKPMEDPVPSPPSKEEAKQQAKLLPLLVSDSDLAELALAADPRLASLYLIAEKAAKRSVMEILQLLSSRGEREDEIDRAIKEIMLEKLKEEIEESKQLRQLLLPLVLQSYQEAQKQRLIQECVSQKMFFYMSQGQSINPQLIQQIQAECAAQATSGTSGTSFLGLLGSLLGFSQPNGQHLQPQDNSQMEVSEDELGSI